MAPRTKKPERRPSVSYLTDTLPSALPPIFEQAQNTTASHRKNIVQLFKVQKTCAEVTEETEKGIRLVGERAFNALFINMINRVLPVKKRVAVADRVVRFVASYVAYTTEQDTIEEEDGDSMSQRFVAKLVRHLLAGAEAKDKSVRFRVTLMLASLINGLGEIDDDQYVAIRQGLLDRARDKESAVRVQAALGLAKLQAGENVDDLEDGEESIAEVILDLLRHDPAAEVRRAALYNLPRSSATLPVILTRTRDIDPILRRTVFHGSFSSASMPDARVLTITQREEAVRNGLGDREPSVRKAAAGMIGGWFDQAECDLLEFLNRFDVVSGEVAEEALLSLFVTRPETLENIDFPDEWWVNLSPEKAFLARVFAEYCVSNKDESRLEDAMPVVTALAFRIQDQYNELVNVAGNEDDMQEKSFIVGELLRLALTSDYADETGRRKMFAMSREMIAMPDLPDALIPRCLDVLKKISTSERDLIRLIVDVVTELRMGDGDVEDPDSAGRSSSVGVSRPAPEEQHAAALIDLRCLNICIGLLERVNTPLQENSVFHGLLPDLIIPAVRNKDEPALRDQGIVCLGLCCMIDEKMAAQSFGLFIQQVASADDELKVKVVRIIFDLFMVHDIPAMLEDTIGAHRIAELVRHMVLQDAPAVQAAACEGVAKLMLAGIVDDTDVLQTVVMLYFSPDTADNQPLRQCLTYFLPVYCYSSSENQARMLSIFNDTLNHVSTFAEDFEGSPDLLPLAQMGLMMVDWLDPEKAVGNHVDIGMHLDLGIVLLKLLLTETVRDIRKAAAGYLSKLSLPEDGQADMWKTKAAFTLIQAVRDKRPMSEVAPRKALERFQATLLKQYRELEGYDEDAFRADGDEHEETSELWGFIDDIDEIPASPVKRGSRATSRARSSATPSGASDSDTPVRSRRVPQTVVEEDEEEDDDVDAMLDSD
ncbi:hypothetical protein CcaverHIS002_0206170 [Cutaneotrichosporon cavernicola]|uniref:Nuclear condensin complex subunit 3 C-terminal domain-containing protein n=1 Tax=Cutaneotrichosporon cavernicola TaxID=279322 RepID=A0AA48IDU8_9TREE|nr:uncharacterized protein CcaverHIS019_0206130 [Cutaneotrichosporon cavernicola]BEI81457.1 hypothetical protein CcaverHIS002_0206170 [Cutaneotrichosporon cavernicola]BEI89251.1 hypothetical protein CcaverHIS019_0206130 [Cutaneotrichosporon cavernicola]